MEQEVKEANKRFYNAVADVYEKIDGRRNLKKNKWIGRKLRWLSERAGKEDFLDLGCGTGFVLRYARSYFTRTVGVDISEEILKKAEPYCDEVVCTDVDKLPFEDESFDVVCCFSLLHHCYTHDKLFKEASRVLRPGGMIYTDHDMDKEFYKNFRWLLQPYRKINNVGKKYQKVPGVDKTMYELSEIHSNGLNITEVLKPLIAAGFGEVTIDYHWKGMHKHVGEIMNYIYKGKIPQGWAPVFSIIARKENGSDI